jgi:hypothetical protein
MTFKCANTIYLVGLDESDLVTVETGTKRVTTNMYFPGEGDGCNIAFNKNTEPFEVGTLTDGCAPMTCDNQRGLSNMVWGTCELVDGEWMWECGGKIETSDGDYSDWVCPPAEALGVQSLAADGLNAIAAEGELDSASQGAASAGGGVAVPLSMVASGVSVVALLVVVAVVVRMWRMQKELAARQLQSSSSKDYTLGSVVLNLDGASSAGDASRTVSTAKLLPATSAPM